MLVLPAGILQGARLKQCSDEARLHFPRLAAITNGYGRIELNLRTILETAYADFREPPTRAQLNGWLKEYADAYLLFIYEDAEGAPWGQWCDAPEHILPRFKTAADKRSPEPPEKELAQFDELYAATQRDSGDFFAAEMHFGSLPKALKVSRSAPKTSADEVVGEVKDEVEGEGEGVDEKQKQTASQPAAEKLARAHAAKTSARQKPSLYRKQAERVYEAYPHKVGRSEALNAIGKAIARLHERGIADPVEHLRTCIETWLRKREQDRNADQFVPVYPNPATWFNQGRYDDPDSLPQPKTEWRVLSDEEAAAAWDRDFGIVRSAEETGGAHVA